LDEDGRAGTRDIVILVNHLTGAVLLPDVLRPFADLNGDGILNDTDVDALARAVLGMEVLQALPITTVRSTSPAAGADDVAVTRETVIYFTQPLASSTVLTTESFYAEFGGQRILARAELSSDRRKASLFYLEPLPGGSRVRVVFRSDGVLDAYGRGVDGDGDGVSGGVFQMDFSTLSLTTVEGTAVMGRVFASELVAGGAPGESVNVPLEGVTITLDGMEETVRAVTDSLGDFRLEPVPAGEFFVHIDGRTVGPYDPSQPYYPFVGKKWSAAAGTETSVGNIFLPLVTAGTLQPVSAVEDTQVTFPAGVLSEYPELEGVSITVPANSLFSNEGVRGGRVGIAPVPPDRIPSPLPEGLDFPLVITVQTDGGSNFDRPVPVCFPNLPDPVTGELLPAGAKSALWSFNHDTGDWEIVGPMTVSADGKTVCTDPGVGILQPGWHAVLQWIRGSGGQLGTGGGGGGGQEPPNNCQGVPNPTDPVHLFSGEFYLRAVDMEIRGRGFDFIWSRKYRSRIGRDTAQGNGWDSGYDIRLEAEGSGYVLFDGDARQDRYERGSDGSYVAAGFFRRLVPESDGSLTLQFEDHRQWLFYRHDGSARAGRLASMVDRHGNVMQFFYDAQGRLERVRETLGRDVVIRYNAQGFVESVTDFLGRQVRYAYYDGVEPGGSWGDLKSVTTPAVIGTPTGNDFPDGKTTKYTYSTGYADDRLNHNLLTITDGRRNDPGDETYGDGPTIVNVYSTTTDPAASDFDRVIRQVWGGDVVDFAYYPALPSLLNGFTVMRTLLNDRAGHVKEYFHDAGNRLVRMREYTGLADPVRPTTLTANRPAGRLRESDPEYFETVYQWNEDSLQTRVIHPNGNITEYVYEQDLNPQASPRSRGNLRQVIQRPGSHVPAGDQDMIVTSFEYDAGFDSCCGFNFVTRQVDGRGNVTSHTYDAQGNRIRTVHREPDSVEEYEYNEFGQMTAHVWPDNGSGQRRRDEYRYYSDGVQKGYRSTEILDVGNFALTSLFEYDGAGNVVRVVDPRGNDIEVIYNELDQKVREISRDPAPGSGVRYTRDIFYDANNNITRIEVLNADETGQVDANNTHWTTTYEYEVLNNLVRETREIGSAEFAVVEFEYDGNRNLVRERHGEAAAGRQTSNEWLTRYDERDLIYEIVGAPGASEQSTDRFSYDANRNPVLVEAGLEDGALLTRTVFDGFDRMVESIDAMGNRTVSEYDANGNNVRTRIWGELKDLAGAEGNVLLQDVWARYDALDRLVRKEELHFDAASQQVIGDGKSVAELRYNPNSQVTRLQNDNGHRTTFTYDTLNRRTLVTDARGNTKAFGYDDNSNIILVTEVERSDLGAPDETYRTEYTYDGLNRLIRTVDPAGNRHDFGYDSRGNRTLAVDAMRSAAEEPGNVVRYAFDGLDRLVRTERYLTSDGTGNGTPVGSIVTRQEWDASDRLVARIDDRGNRTVYRYDGLDRMIGMEHADGTSVSFAVDAHGRRIAVLDANGTQSAMTYDGLGRLTRKDIVPGAGVSFDTTYEVYAYDGLSRLVYAEDDDSVVIRSYDSLSRVLEESLNGQTTALRFDGVGNLREAVYPGGRRVTFAFDELERLQQVSDDGGMIAGYAYAGPVRLARKQYGNGTETRLAYDAARRTALIEHGRNTTLLGDLRYQWDSMFNKVREVDGMPGGITRDFGYDSSYRLVQSDRSVTGGGLDTLAYGLDGAGNRNNVSGRTDPGTYSLSTTLPEPADAPVNQYTATPFDTREYDANGNLIGISAMGQQKASIEYDYRNQMVTYVDALGGTAAAYGYDALGRRIWKHVDDGSPETTFFFFAGPHVIEERDGSGLTTSTFVYGSGIDEVLSMRRGGQDYYYHTDDLGSVRFVTDASGVPVEYYGYEDYGESAVLDAAGSPLPGSAVGNPYRYTGRRLDTESGLSYYRTRYLDHRAGRFTTRDSVGIWTDGYNLGNGYTYAASNPHTMVDPMGLWSVKKWILTGDGNAADNVYEDAKREFQNVLWDRTNGTVETLTMGNADAMSLTRVFTPSTWGEETGETAHVFDAHEQAKARCFARCWAKKTGDAVFGALPLPVSLPISPASALVDASQGKGFGSAIDTDPEDVAASLAGNVGELAKRREIAREVGRLKGLKNFVNSSLANGMSTGSHMAGGSMQRGMSEKMLRRRLEDAAKLNRQIREAPDKLGAKMNGLQKVAGGLSALALIHELKRCYDECEKNPCAH
jgi:RHS repeat-associated protein